MKIYKYKGIIVIEESGEPDIFLDSAKVVPDTANESITIFADELNRKIIIPDYTVIETSNGNTFTSFKDAYSYLNSIISSSNVVLNNSEGTTWIGQGSGVVVNYVEGTVLQDPVLLKAVDPDEAQIITVTYIDGSSEQRPGNFISSNNNPIIAVTSGWDSDRFSLYKA